MSAGPCSLKALEKYLLASASVLEVVINPWHAAAYRCISQIHIFAVKRYLRASFLPLKRTFAMIDLSLTLICDDLLLTSHNSGILFPYKERL